MNDRARAVMASVLAVAAVLPGIARADDPVQPTDAGKPAQVPAGGGGASMQPAPGSVGWGRTRVIAPVVRAARPALLAENTFVPPTAGRLVIGGTGERYFVFDKASDGTRLPAVVLLPSLELGALERLAAQSTPAAETEGSSAVTTATRLLVSGQVFVYRGRNYMMLSAPPMLERVQVAPRAAAGAEGAGNAGANPANGGAQPGRTPPAPVSDEADPEVADIIADLEREAGTRRSITSVAPDERTTGAGDAQALADAGSALGAAGGVRSVAPLALRRGRLVRGPQGSWLFAPDNGPGNPAEPPLVVLPCMNLQAMEATAERLGESATFLVSGDVSSYQGRNYVLPRLFFAERVSSNLTPVQ